MWVARLGIYVIGLAAGGLAMAGYASFDPETWVLDIHPFNLREFVLAGAAAVGNGMAALAVVRGWRRK